MIKCKQGYPVECKDRFPTVSVPGYPRSKDPIPHKSNKTAYVVGYRNVIMADYKYRTITSGFGESEGSYAEGRKEVVYLVTCNPWQKPFIVRTFDIE